MRTCGARGEDGGQRRAASRHRYPRGTEVDQGGVTQGVEQDIGRLDVAVQEARPVHSFEAVKQGPQHAVEFRARLAVGPGRRLAYEMSDISRKPKADLHHSAGLWPGRVTPCGAAGAPACRPATPLRGTRPGNNPEITRLRSEVTHACAMLF